MFAAAFEIPKFHDFPTVKKFFVEVRGPCFFLFLFFLHFMVVFLSSNERFFWRIMPRKWKKGSTFPMIPSLCLNSSRRSALRIFSRCLFFAFLLLASATSLSSV